MGGDMQQRSSAGFEPLTLQLLGIAVIRPKIDGHYTHIVSVNTLEGSSIFILRGFS